MSDIIRIRAVQKKTGLSRSSVYRLVQAGEFPTPIKLSERCSGWIESEVADWVAGRIEASRANSHA